MELLSALIWCHGLEYKRLPLRFLWPVSSGLLRSRKTFQTCLFSSRLFVWARNAIHCCLTTSGAMKNDIRERCGQPHVNRLLTVYSDQNRRACLNSWRLQCMVCVNWKKKKKRCTLNKKGSWNDNCFNGVTPNLSCYKTQINGAPEKRKSPSQNH